MEKTRPPRITFRHLGNHLLEAINLERGLPFTIYALTLFPGKAIREYLLEDRTRLVPPLRLLLFSVAIATFLTVTFIDLSESFSQGLMKGYESGAQMNPDATPPAESMEKLNEFNQQFQEWFRNYYNVILLVGVPILSLFTFWLLRKTYFLAEHLVINMYITSWWTILYIALMPLFYWDYLTVSIPYFFATVGYSIFAFQRIFQLRRWESIWKGLLINILYFVTYMIVISLLAGLLIGYLMVR